jgi:hypothetical protein
LAATIDPRRDLEPPQATADRPGGWVVGGEDGRAVVGFLEGVLYLFKSDEEWLAMYPPVGGIVIDVEAEKQGIARSSADPVRQVERLAKLRDAEKSRAIHILRRSFRGDCWLQPRGDPNAGADATVEPRDQWVHPGSGDVVWRPSPWATVRILGTDYDEWALRWFVDDVSLVVCTRP